MIPLAKNIKRYFSLREVMIVLLAIVISISAGVGVFLALKKEVAINDNGKQFVVKTMKTTVREVLDQNGIVVKPYDYISLPLDSKLHRIKKTEINIKRAVPINVLVDGKEVKIMTYMDTVKEALNQGSVELKDTDKVDLINSDDTVIRTLALSDSIQKDMNLKVTRVREELFTEKFAIPFKVVTRENNRLDKGSERVIKEGKEGVQEKIYRVVMENGKEISKEFLKEAVISSPIDRIIEVGTILNHSTSRGDNFRFTKVLDMRATAYTASYQDTGKHPGDPDFGITYTGIKVKKGVIAVDPKVIPLGTRVYVEVAGSTPDYGYAVAADIGGAIKGNLIDLYFDDQGSVNNWGCKKVKVYILTN